MFSLIHSTVVLVLALAFLVVGLFSPILALAFCFSICRSLRRIADSSVRVVVVANRFSKELDEIPAEHYDGARPGVFNSMFGR
jgi:hypothetical protein